MKKIYGLVGAIVLLAGAFGAQAQLAPTAVVSGAAASGGGIASPGVIAYPVPTQTGDIIQFNNLQIESVSGTNAPAEIIAANANYYPPTPLEGASGAVPQAAPSASASAGAAKCFAFDSPTSNTAQPISCPTPPQPAASSSTAQPSSGISSAASAAILFRPPVFAYRIEIAANTILRLRDQSPATLADFAPGDSINVYGAYNQDGSIQAYIVRDLSKPAEKQFIQLNNVQVISTTASSNPQTLVVVQEQAYPCYGFGDGNATKQTIACPMGLQSLSESPAAANVTLPPSIAPNIAMLRKYVVTVDSQTIILDRGRNPISFADIKGGDSLNIYGTMDSDNATSLNADIVRDLSEPITSTGVSGTVTSVNSDGSFVLQTSDGQTLTIENPIEPGARVQLSGIINALQRIMIQITSMTVKSAAQPSPVIVPPPGAQSPTNQ
ncbi:MAG TPA: DUF5666 domain-containing protein [Candidatus Paceibacterota bacterium]|nr:DUF5666 domain-containing protein [Candidatus Paceibacterota bacterium]